MFLESTKKWGRGITILLDLICSPLPFKSFKLHYFLHRSSGHVTRTTACNTCAPRCCPSLPRSSWLAQMDKWRMQLPLQVLFRPEIVCQGHEKIEIFCSCLCRQKSTLFKFKVLENCRRALMFRILPVQVLVDQTPSRTPGFASRRSPSQPKVGSYILLLSICASRELLGSEG